MLGMIQLCFPARDCKAWAVELAIEEVVTAYPAPAKDAAPRRQPTWKRGSGAGLEEKGAGK
ncbi:MAG TPA: hypothetical protein VK403_12030 [Allosphingosinicella sp.]|nr:hypothetical protein [Allosphingosinicella sp.]